MNIEALIGSGFERIWLLALVALTAGVLVTSAAEAICDRLARPAR